jgi:hypothetical protein
MCKDGAGKNQKPSANDIALARAGGYYDQVFTQDFLPLEVQEIEQWRDPAVRGVNQGLLAGRMNADTAVAEREAFAANRALAAAKGVDLTSGQGVVGIDDTGGLAARGLADANIDASRAARGISDSEGLGILRTGQGLAKGVVNSASALSRADTYRNAEKLRAKTTERGALIDAIGTVGMAAGAKYRGMQADKKHEEWMKTQQGLWDRLVPPTAASSVQQPPSRIPQWMDK